mmetsp:Transcript_124661/g.216111  ORF Transcript_124661/g.216111 Transcript_124661/m.216111 type:complete len:284 (-) Transcript_124661:118-969(-)
MTQRSWCWCSMHSRCISERGMAGFDAWTWRAGGLGCGWGGAHRWQVCRRSSQPWRLGNTTAGCVPQCAVRMVGLTAAVCTARRSPRRYSRHGVCRQVGNRCSHGTAASLGQCQRHSIGAALQSWTPARRKCTRRSGRRSCGSSPHGRFGSSRPRRVGLPGSRGTWVPGLRLRGGWTVRCGGRTAMGRMAAWGRARRSGCGSSRRSPCGQGASLGPGPGWSRTKLLDPRGERAVSPSPLPRGPRSACHQRPHRLRQAPWPRPRNAPRRFCPLPHSPLPRNACRR